MIEGRKGGSFGLWEEILFLVRGRIVAARIGVLVGRRRKIAEKGDFFKKTFSTHRKISEGRRKKE